MNSRFSIAVHILTLLASTPDERMTSEFMALSIGTNAVVIRRLLAHLREAGLVTSQGAKGGGWMLTRKPRAIKLSEVRAALVDQTSFTMHRNEPHPHCAVGRHVRDSLQLVYADADAAVDAKLAKWSVQDVLDDVKQTRP